MTLDHGDHVASQNTNLLQKTNTTILAKLKDLLMLNSTIWRRKIDDYRQARSFDFRDSEFIYFAASNINSTILNYIIRLGAC
jgi:hypothetical protein